MLGKKRRHLQTRWLVECCQQDQDTPAVVDAGFAFRFVDLLIFGSAVWDGRGYFIRIVLFDHVVMV